jgi:hypothetical protein
VVTLILPVDAALDLALEESWVLTGSQGHFDVDVRVGLQFTAHRLELKVVSTKHIQILKIVFKLTT